MCIIPYFFWWWFQDTTANVLFVVKSTSVICVCAYVTKFSLQSLKKVTNHQTEASIWDKIKSVDFDNMLKYKSVWCAWITSSEWVIDEQPMCFLRNHVFYPKPLSSPAYTTIENTIACIIDLSLELDASERDIWTTGQTVCHSALSPADPLMRLVIKKMIINHFT